MPKDIYDIMLNSIRMRIIQIVATKESMSATEICDKINDVPRTTLYRHINILLDANVLTVVEEKRIRGSVERTLALNMDEIAKHNTMENMPQQAFGFLMNTYAKFEKYFNKENFVPANSKIFFNNTVMMLDDQEFDKFLLELQALFLKYHFDVAHKRKPRDISIISAPVESENENGNK
jgi:DNA-binding transcriptional ArsR family regulator